jgi:hypothetical protein
MIVRDGIGKRNTLHQTFNFSVFATTQDSLDQGLPPFSQVTRMVQYGGKSVCFEKIMSTTWHLFTKVCIPLVRNPWLR